MENSRLSVKEKIGYGMGDAGCNIIFGAIMLFVNYFYTDIFGLAPALVGVLLLSIRVIDAVTDPIMGAIADRTRSRFGRFRPWLLWIAFPYALFSVLMFTTPDWSYSSKVVYAFVTYFLLSITYTAINIPYCSLGSVITNDPKERVACQSYRFVMVGIATLLLSLTLLPMVDYFGGGDKAKGYQIAMTILALIGMCMFLFSFATVRERIRPAVLFISLGVVGMMIGSTLAKVLTDRWCKLKVFFWTNIVLAIFSSGFYFLNPHATVLIVVMYFLLNVLHQIPSPLHWSLMADVDDYGEWKTGKRITGISFSGNLFFLKLGLAIAGALVGFLLSWYGYDAGAKAQSDSALNGIVMLFTVIPGVGYLITAGVVRMLKVDRELMARIQRDLEKRRENYRELADYPQTKPVEVKP